MPGSALSSDTTSVGTKPRGMASCFRRRIAMRPISSSMATSGLSFALHVREKWSQKPFAFAQLAGAGFGRKPAFRIPRDARGRVVRVHAPCCGLRLRNQDMKSSPCEAAFHDVRICARRGLAPRAGRIPFGLRAGRSRFCLERRRAGTIDGRKPRRTAHRCPLTKLSGRNRVGGQRLYSQGHFAMGGKLISTASGSCPVSSPNRVPRS